MVPFEGLTLIGCRNISNHKGVIWREVLLLYAGQEIQSAIKGNCACINSVSGVDAAFQTTWVAGLEVAVLGLPDLMELTFILSLLPEEVGCSISGKPSLAEGADGNEYHPSCLCNVWWT